MSFILLYGFIQMYADKIPREHLSSEYLIIWALFAIADALWIRAVTK